MAPMSPPPCTLFCPRSGLSPLPRSDRRGRQQREVDQAQDVVDPVVVLGDAERPAQSAPCPPSHRRGRARGSSSARYAGLHLAPLEGPVLDRRRVLSNPSSRARRTSCDQPGVDDLPSDRVRGRAMSVPVFMPSQRSAKCAVEVRRGSTTNSRALDAPPEHVVEEDRVRLARVRAPEDDDIGVLYLRVAARATAQPEDGRQTDDRGRVSGAVAGVDVVGPDGLPDELLREVVGLVRRLRAGEEADSIGAVVVDRADPSATLVSASSHDASRNPPASRTNGVVNRRYGCSAWRRRGI